MSDDPFDFDDFDDDVEPTPQNRAPSKRVERFKGEQGKIYRVSLLYFHPLDVSLAKRLKKKAEKEGVPLDVAAAKKTVAAALAKRAEALGKAVDDLQPWEKLDTSKAQFKLFKSHYKEGVGVILSRLGKDGPEGDKVWSTLPEPSTYYSTVVLIYPTDSAGEVDAKNILRDGVVKPWRFGPKTFNTLISKNQVIQKYGSDKSLANSDLTLECSNGQFQNFEIEPAGEALWSRSQKIKEHFLPKAVALYDKIVDAREMTTNELREKLGMGGGGDSSDVSDDIDLSDDEDILANV